MDAGGDEDDAPTDSDDEDSDDGGGRQKAPVKAPPAEPIKPQSEAPPPAAETTTAEASSSASADAGKGLLKSGKDGGRTKSSKQKRAQKRMKELELLSSEAASQFDILGLFQQRCFPVSYMILSPTENVPSLHDLGVSFAPSLSH